MLAKSKIITIKKFIDWLEKNKSYIILGTTDGKVGWNLKNYANKPYECGCGHTHKFMPGWTILYWRARFTDARLIVQDPSCTFICYLEMKGIFIVNFETKYSTNQYTGDKELDEKNARRLVSLITSKTTSILTKNIK